MLARLLVYTRPSGEVSVVGIASALVMEFARDGKATGTLLWEGSPVEEPGAVMSLAAAFSAALDMVRAGDIPGGSLYETTKRPGRKAWMMSPPPDGLGLSDAEATARLDAEATVAQASVAEVASDDLVALGVYHPDGSHKPFRNCLRQDGQRACRIDMPLARVQRMAEVRAKRALKIIKSDVDIMRAAETKNTTLQTSLGNYRQKLRDLPAAEQPNIDAITTPDELATWEPTWPVDPTATSP